MMPPYTLNNPNNINTAHTMINTIEPVRNKKMDAVINMIPIEIFVLDFNNPRSFTDLVFNDLELK